jgi:hypothetical protein
LSERAISDFVIPHCSFSDFTIIVGYRKLPGRKAPKRRDVREVTG